MSCGELGAKVSLDDVVKRGVKCAYNFIVSSLIWCIGRTGKRTYEMERGVVYEVYSDQALFVCFAIFPRGSISALGWITRFTIILARDFFIHASKSGVHRERSG